MRYITNKYRKVKLEENKQARRYTENIESIILRLTSMMCKNYYVTVFVQFNMII